MSKLVYQTNQLISLTKMDIKILIFSAFMFFLFRCKSDDICPEINNSQDLIFYISGLEEGCTYKLGSQIFPEELKCQIFIEDDIVIFKVENSDQIDTFLILDRAESDISYAINLEDFEYKKGVGKIHKNLKSELLQIIGDTYVLCFYDVLNVFFTGRVLNAIVFFEKEKGFIGSYFQDPNDMTWIIQKSGNILESEIDYSDKKFGQLR